MPTATTSPVAPPSGPGAGPPPASPPVEPPEPEPGGRRRCPSPARRDGREEPAATAALAAVAAARDPGVRPSDQPAAGF